MEKLAFVAFCGFVGILGAKVWGYAGYDDRIEERCLYGDLAGIASISADKPKFCNCLGSRAKSKLGFVQFATWVNDDTKRLESLIVESATQCQMAHG